MVSFFLGRVVDSYEALASGEEDSIEEREGVEGGREEGGRREDGGVVGSLAIWKERWR
jgi:hypothetical protein